MPRMTVVLDNAEHVRSGAADVADALRARCPEVRIVVTSRIPLGSQGEIEFPVSPMPVPSESATAGRAACLRCSPTAGGTGASLAADRCARRPITRGSGADLS